MNDIANNRTGPVPNPPLWLSLQQARELRRVATGQCSTPRQPAAQGEVADACS